MLLTMVFDNGLHSRQKNMKQSWEITAYANREVTRNGPSKQTDSFNYTGERISGANVDEKD